VPNPSNLIRVMPAKGWKDGNAALPFRSV